MFILIGLYLKNFHIEYLNILFLIGIKKLNKLNLIKKKIYKNLKIN